MNPILALGLPSGTEWILLLVLILLVFIPPLLIAAVCLALVYTYRVVRDARNGKNIGDPLDEGQK
jgi:hypothetical protein